MTPTLSKPITALPDILKNNLLSDETNFEEVVIIDLRPCDYITSTCEEYNEIPTFELA